MPKGKVQRPNPKTFTIIDKCPQCQREFGWDACADTYVGAKNEITSVNKPGVGCQVVKRILILEVCPDCDAVIAVQVLDNRGGEVYVPTTKEL